MKRICCLLSALVCFVNVNNGRADDLPAGVVVPLFDGQSLDGWHVSDCTVAVEDGAMALKEGNGFVRHDHRFSDFTLELEWKAVDDAKWDSGIYFHAQAPPKGRPWPKRYQINLLKGQEGNLVGAKDATSKGLVKDGQWNHFRLTVVGAKASLEINGQPAWTFDDLQTQNGYIGIQAEVPGGGQFLFRNIRIVEVGYLPLFDGKSLAGWEGAGADAESCWAVRDGLLTCTGEKGTWLRTTDQFGDFNLRLEYKLEPGGNSGVYARVPKSGDHHGAGAGVEIQVLDDAHEKHAKLKPYQYSGSVYAIAPAEPRVSREPGKWNTLEINTEGKAYRVVHNGAEVVNADPQEYSELSERLSEGFLGLQNHRSKVWFRNLRIGPPQP